jgi:NitT/TauT family transport system ATP-binding protein
MRSDAPAIRFDHVTCSFRSPSGAPWVAIDGVSCDVAPGSFVAVVGASGCGKSTLLNLAAGLLTPTRGSIQIFGEALAGLNRRAGYLAQHDTLLPWKDVLENVTLGLTFRGMARAEAVERGRTWLSRVGLDAHAARFPYQLSGGMRKRLALAQHLILEPAILLLDEPFSALDVHTRQRMGEELLSLWAGTRTTMLLVTHDLDEAISLADRVVVMTADPGGRIRGEYDVSLSRPRHVLDLRTDAAFGELYRAIWSALRDEVRRTEAALPR